jgi:hypothetical protein
MFREHAPEPEVGDLIPVQGIESLIIDVAADCQLEAFACSSLHGVDAVLDSYAKACSVSEEVDYPIFQISHAHHDVRDPICFEPFDHPLQKGFSAHLYKPFWQVCGYGS